MMGIPGFGFGLGGLGFGGFGGLGAMKAIDYGHWFDSPAPAGAGSDWSPYTSAISNMSLFGGGGFGFGGLGGFGFGVGGMSFGAAYSMFGGGRTWFPRIAGLGSGTFRPGYDGGAQAGGAPQAAGPAAAAAPQGPTAGDWADKAAPESGDDAQDAGAKDDPDKPKTEGPDKADAPDSPTKKKPYEGWSDEQKKTGRRFVARIKGTSSGGLGGTSGDYTLTVYPTDTPGTMRVVARYKDADSRGTPTEQKAVRTAVRKLARDVKVEFAFLKGRAPKAAAPAPAAGATGDDATAAPAAPAKPAAPTTNKVRTKWNAATATGRPSAARVVGDITMQYDQAPATLVIHYKDGFKDEAEAVQKKLQDDKELSNVTISTAAIAAPAPARAPN